MIQSIGKAKVSFDRILAELNSSQRKAVETIEGPVLVIAGPGTGKTQIIAARIGYILNSKEAQMNPENILCLTFTDSGAVSMRKRLIEFIGPTAYRVGIYTFHSFCNEVVQQNLDYFGKRFLEPISELENVQLIESMLRGLPFDHPLKNFRGDLSYDVAKLKNLFRMMKEENWSAEYIRKSSENYLKELPKREKFLYRGHNRSKGYKSGDLKLERIASEKSKMEKLTAAAELFPEYQKRMKEMNRYDFSDMILWVIDAFKKDENLLRNYQERYQYFMVDEFQDTSGAQNEVLNLLTSYWHPANVFCVGDDDQSIYEFQGARIRNIRDFAECNKEFLTKIVLTENYRSTQHILDYAKNLIDNNAERLINDDRDLSKDLQAALQERISSKVEPLIHAYPNLSHEEAAVIHKIELLQRENVPLNEIAIIYFRHAQAENIIHLLEQKNIPYRIRKRINILQLPLINQILSLFLYIKEENRRSFSADHLLFEIMHYRFLGIDPYDIASMAKCIQTSEEKNLSWRTVINNEILLQGLKLRDKEKISKFACQLNAWMSDAFNLTLQMLFEKILNESGLLQFVLTQPQRSFQLQIIQTFFDFVKQCGQKNSSMRIAEFLEVVEQMKAHYIPLEIQNAIDSENGVNLMTCHGAKGLEFEYVFLIGCTSDKWEKARGANFNFALPDTLTLSHDEDRIESTRRLFYVAMTRAKEHLTISYAEKNQDERPVEASRFIYESGIEVRPQKLKAASILDMQESLLAQAPPVEIELFDEDYIRSILKNFTLSHSSLTNYLKCPVKFYFENIIRVPAAKNDSMAFGSAIHWALKRLFDKEKNNNNLFPGTEDLLADFDFFMRKNKDSFTEKQFENRLMLGRKILSEYYDHYQDRWNRIVVSEFYIEHVEVKGVPVKGKLDKIEFDGNKVNVVDYKTGSVKWAREKLSQPISLYPEVFRPSGEADHAQMYGGEYWRQLVFYKILLDNYRRRKWTMISGEIDFLEKNEHHEFEKRRIAMQPEFIPFVEHLITVSYEKIMNHEFTHGCGKEDCNWCNFVRENFDLHEGPTKIMAV